MWPVSRLNMAQSTTMPLSRARTAIERHLCAHTPGAYLAPPCRRDHASHASNSAEASTACSDKRQRRQKHGTEVASMLASLRVRLRKSSTPGLSRAWSRADVVTVLRKGGYAPPYFQRDGRLCIVARDPARPLTPDNAVESMPRPAPSADGGLASAARRPAGRGEG